MPTNEAQETTSRRRVIREQPAFVPPARTPYPPEENLDIILANLEDIVEGDGAQVRVAELARSVWEIHGITLRRRFGDAGVLGSCPEPDPALTQRLHRIERLLASARRRSSDGYAMSTIMSRNGAVSRNDTDALIVLLDSAARTIRTLRDACLVSSNGARADAVQ